MHWKPVSLACVLIVSLNSFGAQLQGASSEPTTEVSYTTLMNSAVAQMIAGNYRAAEPTLLRALNVLENTDADSPAIAITLHNLGMCYRQLGRAAESEIAFRKSLVFAENVLGSDTLEAANTRHSLGSLYCLMGRFSEAESHLRSALATKEKMLAPKDGSIALTLAELGDLELARGRFLYARSLQQRAVRMAQESGIEDARLAGILSRLGVVYLSLGELDNAERTCERSAQIFERVNGPSHVNTAQVLINLGNIARMRRRHDEADALFVRAQEGFSRTFGTNKRDAYILMFQAENEADRGRFSLAERLYKEAVGSLEQDVGSESHKFGLALSIFATVYIRQKKYAEAEPLLRRALAVSKKRWDRNIRRLCTNCTTMLRSFAD